MSQYFAVGSADWHLAPGAWKRHPELRFDAYYSLRQIALLSEQHDIPIFGAGDLFDVKTPDSLSVAESIEILSPLKNKIYIVQGQHEMAEPPWLTTLLPNAEWIHERFTTINGVPVYGLDWVPPVDAPGFFERIPDSTQLFVTHQVWREMVMSQGNSVPLTTLRGGLVVFSGDYHVTIEQPYRSAKDGTYGRFVSPGSICCQSVGEPSQKFVYLITKNLDFQRVPLVTRRIDRHVITTDEELERLLLLDDATLLGGNPGLPEIMQKPLINIRYSTLLDRAYDKLLDRLAGKCFLDLTAVPPDLPPIFDWQLAAPDGSAAKPYEMITADVLQSLGIPSDYYLGAQALWQAPANQLRSVINDTVKNLEASHANDPTGPGEFLPAPVPEH